MAKHLLSFLFLLTITACKKETPPSNTFTTGGVRSVVSTATYDPYHERYQYAFRYALQAYCPDTRSAVYVQFTNTDGTPAVGPAQVDRFDRYVVLPSGHVSLVYSTGINTSTERSYNSTGHSADRVAISLYSGRVVVRGTGIHLVNTADSTDQTTIDLDLLQTAQ